MHDSDVTRSVTASTSRFTLFAFEFALGEGERMLKRLLLQADCSRWLDKARSEYHRCLRTLPLVFDGTAILNNHGEEDIDSRDF